MRACPDICVALARLLLGGAALDPVGALGGPIRFGEDGPRRVCGASSLAPIENSSLDARLPGGSPAFGMTPAPDNVSPASSLFGGIEARALDAARLVDTLKVSNASRAFDQLSGARVITGGATVDALDPGVVGILGLSMSIGDPPIQGRRIALSDADVLELTGQRPIGPARSKELTSTKTWNGQGSLGTDRAVTAHGAGPPGIPTDAVHARLEEPGAVVSGVLNGDVFRGHSEASVPLPEPSRLALFGIGLGTFFVVLRRQARGRPGSGASGTDLMTSRTRGHGGRDPAARHAHSNRKRRASRCP